MNYISKLRTNKQKMSAIMSGKHHVLDRTSDSVRKKNKQTENAQGADF